MSHVRYTVCNRCGVVIENPHPDRITIHKHTTETYTTYFKEQKTKNVYKTDKSLHFCDDCNAAFQRFIAMEEHTDA